MGWITGRDAVDGWVYLSEPTLVKGGGPERVATEEPPKEWVAPPLLGFGTALRPCHICRKQLPANARADTRFCGNSCRQKAYRMRKDDAG